MGEKSNIEEKLVTALEALGSRIAVIEQQVVRLTEATSAKNADENKSEVVQESSDVPSSEVVQESSDATPPGGGRRRRSRRGKRLKKSRRSRRH